LRVPAGRLRPLGRRLLCDRDWPGFISEAGHAAFESGFVAKRIAQSPVAWVINSMGLAPRSCFHARQPSATNGSKQARNASAFVHLLTRILATI
jgi:hypothetical protein